MGVLWHPFSMKKPRVLITGINGTIGQVLVRSFGDEWDIFGLDVTEGERTTIADVSSWPDVDRVFSEAGDIDYVIHLAAIARSDASWDDVLQHNIVGTRYVFERAKEAGVTKVLFASSWHVVGGHHMHGDDSAGTVGVSDAVRPDGDYATSKVFGEALARQYWEQYKMRSVCLRIGNVEANDKPRDAHAERIWLSHRDLSQLVEKGLRSDVDFGIYFAISANTNRFLDISDTERDLEYASQDDSATLSR